MIITSQLEQLQSNTSTAVALGTFDGLHKGHQAVIHAITDRALVPTVFSVLSPPNKECLLTLPREKEDILASMGVEHYIPAPFHAICHWTAEDFFITFLKKRLKAKAIACGFNFRFGKHAAGDTAVLEKLCKTHHIELTVVPPVLEAGQPVSSTRIRSALLEGKTDQAAALLGRPFGFCLPVLHGKQLGRTLGFPTINQALPANFLKPRFGVYAALVTVQGKVYPGVCNIGLRPTVETTAAPLAETHILNFHGDLYHQEINVRLLSFLREEQKFASLEQLQAAIAQNAAQTITIVSKALSANCGDSFS